jgi:hypothetical protein
MGASHGFMNFYLNVYSLVQSSNVYALCGLNALRLETPSSFSSALYTHPPRPRISYNIRQDARTTHGPSSTYLVHLRLI